MPDPVIFLRIQLQTIQLRPRIPRLCKLEKISPKIDYMEVDIIMVV
jgi:hypothetical protein